MDLRRCLFFALDLLFPPWCVACKTQGEWWCVACRESVEIAAHTEVEGLDGVIALGYYHDPTLRLAIHALKYQGLTALRSALSEFISTRWRATLMENVSIQAVPTDPKRQRSRGFDQAEFIADVLQTAVLSQHERVHLLERSSGSGLAQARIHEPELRAANVRHAFRMRGVSHVPHAVLLVDDVITTGSTMREAADVLRAAGVGRVYGFALALGS